MKIGDKVSVLDDAISGVVTAVNSGLVSVLTEDDFEMLFDENELIVMNDLISKKELAPQNITEIISEKESNKKKKTRKIKPKERILPPMVVDLHIHQLVPKSKGMSNYDMLTIQTDTAKRQLDFAIKKRIQRIVFIHGVGEGVLKSELEYLFGRYDNV